MAMRFYWAFFAVFSLDMFTKIYVRYFSSIKYVQNRGSLFGLLGSYDVNLLFVLITAAAVVFIFYYVTKSRLSNYERLTLGLIAGGALGNLTDRILYGAVTDFIDFKVWPVFNIADSAITIGIVLLVWKEFVKKTWE